MTFAELDLTRLRADTPACETLLHFNNAGASLMPRPVHDAVVGHLELETHIGAYEAADQAAGAMSAMYDSFARLLRVNAAEIAYVENATRAWDTAFYALPLAPGDRIITHASEYVSNYLAFLHQARRRGIEIDLAPSDSSGQIDIGAVPALIGPRTRLIAITHVPTSGGLVNPAAEVGRIARDHGLIYLLDACQSVGQIDLDVPAVGCHMLSGTGRKFLRGPRGTGFLYVAEGLLDRLDPPFVDLHSAHWTSDSSYELEPGARRFENWESYIAGRIGLARAVDYALEIGLDRIERRVSTLAAELRAALADVGAKVHDLGQIKSGIVTFEMPGRDSPELAASLRRSGCNVSVADPVEARLDLGRRGLPPLVRASVHYFNTGQEIERFCALLAGNRA
jgi:selenocysteine lyase/cysteine desulfurase